MRGLQALVRFIPEKRTALCQDRIMQCSRKKLPQGEEDVVMRSDPRYCLSACAFSAVNSASLRKVITATLRVR
jgi:hypothetical protein